MGRDREKDQYLAAKIKMEKQIWIFAFLATFVKENVGSMSQDFTKEESHEQENLHNSWAYNTYETLTHSNSISTDKNQDSALECYECNSIGDGELCYNIGRNVTNENKNAFSDHIKKCPGDKPYCKVYRVEYLVLDDFKSVDTGPYTPWSMERNCSDECKNFCVTMGGRTKLTYCTSCCTSNLCNDDNSVAKIKSNKILYFTLCIFAFLLGFK